MASSVSGRDATFYLRRVQCVTVRGRERPGPKPARPGPGADRVRGIRGIRTPAEFPVFFRELMPKQWRTFRSGTRRDFSPLCEMSHFKFFGLSYLFQINFVVINCSYNSMSFKTKVTLILRFFLFRSFTILTSFKLPFCLSLFARINQTV